MLSSIARLVFTFDTELSDEVFQEKLGSRSIKEITRNAHERGGGCMGFAEAILCFYNRKMKYPLDYLRLHSAKGRKPLQDYYDDDLEDIDEYINGSDYPKPYSNATDNVDQQTLFPSDERITAPLSNTL